MKDWFEDSYYGVLKAILNKRIYFNPVISQDEIFFNSIEFNSIEFNWRVGGAELI